MVGMEHLVPIGRFSTMTRLSIKALRHYDDLGLLRPAEVDESTGYRYYALDQANRAEAIRLLRSVDLGLDDIGELLDAGDPDVVTKLLDQHRVRLEDQLETQRRRLALVRRLIEREEPLVPYTVETRSVEAQTALALRVTTTHEDIATTIADGFGALMETLMAVRGQPGGMPFIIFHDVIDDRSAGDIELCLPLPGPVEVPDGPVRCRVLEGATMATTIHTGEYADVAPAYHVLTGWMQAAGHEPAGPPREIYLDDPYQVEPGTQRTEIQWPIG